VFEMRPWHALAFAALGCAAAPPPVRAPEPVCAEAVVAEKTRERLPAPGRATEPNRCLPDGLPVLAKLPAERHGATCRNHAAAERRLRALLSQRFQRTVDGKLEVSFGCDPFGRDVKAIVIETGYGHGGSLQVWRVTKAGGALAAFDVLGVAVDTWVRRSEKDAANTLLVTRATLGARELEAALVSVRPALTAVVREVEPPPLPNSVRLGSSFYSSGDFHQRVWLHDGTGHELEASYTGYPNSDSQRIYLGLELAREALEPLFENFEFQREVAGPELRAWFSQYLVRSWPRHEEPSAWWVRERLITLAGKAGDHSVVPLIVSELERGLAEVAAAPAVGAGELARRYLDGPLAALKGVTGWDARLGGGGPARSYAEAARDAVSECKRGTAISPTPSP
jgi:hypothetical protein